MEYIEILKNAIHYPLNDKYKLLKISIPNIILAILMAMLVISLLMIFGSPDLANYDSSVGIIGILTLILIIAGIFASLYYSGVSLAVIQDSINNSDMLPERSLTQYLVDGLKYIVVNFIYQLVPLIVFLLLAIIAFSIDSDAMLSIASLIQGILSLIVGCLLPVALGRLAETGSISEALSVDNVWNVTKQIGFVEIFVMLLITGLFALVILVISYILLIIPILGYLLLFLVITYLTILFARVYALIYKERNGPQTYTNQNYPQQNYNNFNYQQNMQQYPQNNQYNSQSYQQQYQNPTVNPQNTQANNAPDQILDFIPDENKEDNQPQAPADVNTEQVLFCPACGHQNVENSNFCLKCGAKLK